MSEQRALLLSFLIVAATPASAQTGSRVAADLARHCAETSMDRLDDKISAAADVARAAAIACSSKIQDLALAQATEQGQSGAFAQDLARSLMDGQLFLSVVLEHRTGKKNLAVSPSVLDDQSKGAIFATNRQALAMCSSANLTDRVTCELILFGWIDGYHWGTDRCSLRVAPSSVRLEYVALLGRAPKLIDDPPGAVLGAILHGRSSQCPSASKRKH